MHEHEHRPTFLSFQNTRQTCRCRHCRKPLRCANRWLYYLSLMPALLAVVYVVIVGLSNWPVLLVCLALDGLLQYIAFRHLKFEPDLAAQRDDMQDTLHRR